MKEGREPGDVLARSRDMRFLPVSKIELIIFIIIIIIITSLNIFSTTFFRYSLTAATHFLSVRHLVYYHYGEVTRNDRFLSHITPIGVAMDKYLQIITIMPVIVCRTGTDTGETQGSLGDSIPCKGSFTPN